MIPLWRTKLQPASFNGVQFHVDIGSRGGGRRIALHEFPKKDIPYAEDMGRRAKRFSITAYFIGSNFEDQRDALIVELEKETNGILVLPTSSEQQTVVVDSYNVIERRERGGFCEFEIAFIEAGKDISTQFTADTQGQVTNAVNNGVGGTTSVAGGGSTMMGTANSFGVFAGSTDFNGWQ